MKKRHLLVFALALFASSHAFAVWNLDSKNSSLSFISTKAVDIAEVHHFTELAGRISDNGKAVITIELASIETGIPIRNERMLKMLFEADKYPRATVRSKIDIDIVDAISPGSSKRLTAELMLDLHGVQISIDANVLIVKPDENVLLITSAEPIVLNAGDADLTGGIEALREVASLPSIGSAVPVSFILVFEMSE